MRVTAETRFAIIPEWVLFAPISPNAVRLYGVLARHADKDEHFAIVGRAKLAEQMRCATDTVDRAMNELIGIGAVSLEHRTDPNNSLHLLPNRYRLAVVPAQTSRKDAPTRTRGGTRAHAPSRKDAAENERVLGSKGSKSVTTHHIPEAQRLCDLLAMLVVENGSKKPIITEAWLTEARRMLTLDHRPLDEAERVLRWSQTDDFWRANILSMPTFRAKYDRLRLASTRSTTRRYEGTLDRMAREAMEGIDAKRRSARPSGDGARALPG